MNRSLWTESLTDKYCPEWRCPICKKGTIELVPASLVHKETIDSKRAHHEDGWDPDWIALVFTAWCQCNNQSCKQDFAIAGNGGYEPTYGPEGETDWVRCFYPTLCRPTLEIIDIPSKCPDNVKQELKFAFDLFRSHRAACAGRIRVALECLMNHLGVPKKKKNGHGKFYDLTLHKRIELFASSEPTIGPQLMALKWLGNSGSHEAVVTQNDLLDAFEVMEHSLAEIIDRRSAKVLELAKKLTKKHGK